MKIESPHRLIFPTLLSASLLIAGCGGDSGPRPVESPITGQSTPELDPIPNFVRYDVDLFLRRNFKSDLFPPEVHQKLIQLSLSNRAYVANLTSEKGIYYNIFALYQSVNPSQIFTFHATIHIPDISATDKLRMLTHPREVWDKYSLIRPPKPFHCGEIVGQNEKRIDCDASWTTVDGIERTAIMRTIKDTSGSSILIDYRELYPKPK